jgi:transcriptional regulator with XRE-family HTH domain
LNPDWVETVRRLGLRLRELRKQAGLTQGELARRLGRTGPGGKSYVCRIERGDFPGLGLHVVGRFLSACGVGMRDIADVLEGYISLPPVLEQRARQAVLDATAGLLPVQRDRAENYDIGLRLKAGQRVRTRQDIEKRVRQAVKRAKSEAWNRRLHFMFNNVLDELHVSSTDHLSIFLKAYGRKVFGALRRTRKTRPVWREKAMAKLDLWASEHELPPEPFVRMKQAVIALFAEMERRGELD